MMYITIGKKTKHYYPDEWQFTAYQFLNVHIDDSNMIDKPFCIKDNQKIELVDTYKGRKLNHWQLPYSDNLKPTAGNVEIGYETTNGVIKEKIVILPSILSGEELQEMAKMIGDIVFNYHSFTRANFSQLTNQGMNNGENFIGANLRKKDGYSEYILNQLPSFFDVLEKNIAIIKKNPALGMQAVVKEANIIKSNKPKDLLIRKLQPNKKHVLNYDKSYDEYSVENKWLGYLIFEILTKILNSFLPNFKQYKSNNSFDNNNYNELGIAITHLNNRLDKIKSDDFIKNFNLNLKRQPIITTRLIKMKGYQAIVQAYQEIFNENFLQAFDFYNDVITAYSSGYMDNLSNIYEYWCLAVLYDNLLKIGFEPDGNQYRLENIISLQDNNLVIPSGSFFVLRKPFAQYDNNNRGDIVVRLHYEPKLFFNHQAMLQNSQKYCDYLMPDIFMEINAPRRVYGVTNFSLILDAKFKNYQNLDLDYWLNRNHDIKDIRYFQDIMHTAMWKYHYRLNDFFIIGDDQPKLRVNMSAILSPNIDFLWRGEKPLINCDFLQNQREQVEKLFANFNDLNNDIYKSFAAHKFGTLTLRPKELGKDIRRLFAMIFYYHMGLTSLCLNCGRELCNEKEFYVNDFDDGAYAVTKSEQLCQQLSGMLGGFIDRDWRDENPTTRFRACCENCQTQWRVSFCANQDTDLHYHTPQANNRIIKLGIDDEIGYIPIHYKDDQGTHCPKCGNINAQSPMLDIPIYLAMDTFGDCPF